MRDASWYDTVLEGVAADNYPYCANKTEDLVFVGELVPHKGVHLAIQAAQRLGRNLKIIGRSRVLDVPEEARKNQAEYLDTQVLPYIDGIRISYLGELGNERLEHVRRAKAVLCPIQWEEPFGRIMAESMACGTPVIAMNRGAVPEVIADGKSGFIVHDLDELIEAVKSVHVLNPADCREHVETRLSMKRVADHYIKMYEQIRAKH